MNVVSRILISCKGFPIFGLGGREGRTLALVWRQMDATVSCQMCLLKIRLFTRWKLAGKLRSVLVDSFVCSKQRIAFKCLTTLVALKFQSCWNSPIVFLIGVEDSFVLLNE